MGILFLKVVEIYNVVDFLTHFSSTYNEYTLYKDFPRIDINVDVFLVGF